MPLKVKCSCYDLRRKHAEKFLCSPESNCLYRYLQLWLLLLLLLNSHNYKILNAIPPFLVSSLGIATVSYK